MESNLSLKCVILSGGDFEYNEVEGGIVRDEELNILIF